MSLWTVSASGQTQSPVAVVVGQTVGVVTDSKDNATIRVETVLEGKTLAGKPLPAQIQVTPAWRLLETPLIGKPKARLNPRQGVVLLLTQYGNDKPDFWRFPMRGAEVILFNSENKAQMITGAKRYLAFSHDEKIDTARRTRTMFDWAKGNNAFLRAQGQSFLAHSKYDHAKYKNQLGQLLSHPDAGTRISALYGLNRIKSPAVLPFLIQATRDTNKEIQFAASHFLGSYDTPASAAALAVLAKSPDYRLQVSALQALELSKQKAARDVFVTLLDDPKASIRGLAATKLMTWIYHGQADNAIPKLLDLFQSEKPDSEAMDGVISGLSAIRHPIYSDKALKNLLSLLERPHLDNQFVSQTVEGIYILYKWGIEQHNAAIQKQVNDNLDIFISLMATKQAHALECEYSIINILSLNKSPIALDALKDATQSAPDASIRQYAAEMLEDAQKP